MHSQKKVKFIIGLAISIIVLLFVTTIVQIIDIYQTNKKLEKQQQQIEQLNRELDYYENKQPSNHEEIIL